MAQKRITSNARWGDELVQAALDRKAEPGFWQDGGVVPDGVVCTFRRDSGTPPGVSGRLVQSICRIRSMRQAQFPGALGSDSCWDLLLQLYAAHLDQQRLNISRLTAQTQLPATTVLRALDTLTSAGFAARKADWRDRRRVLIELTTAGVAAMNRYFLESGARAIFI